MFVGLTASIQAKGLDQQHHYLAGLLDLSVMADR